MLALLISTNPDVLSQSAARRSEPSPDSARINGILSRMTLEEKVRMLFGGEQPGVSQLPGVPRLHIPALLPSDGSRGMTAAIDTALPSGIGMASSWDSTLFEAVGEELGQEARAAGKTMVFAPALNIERDVLGGRFLSTLRKIHI